MKPQPDLEADIRRANAYIRNRITEDLQRAVEQVRAHQRTTPVESWFIPRDQVYVFEGRPLVHPSTMMMLQNNGRVPFWSQRTLGEREMQRDRRRHGAAATTRR